MTVPKFRRASRNRLKTEYEYFYFKLKMTKNIEFYFYKNQKAVTLAVIFRSNMKYVQKNAACFIAPTLALLT